MSCLSSKEEDLIGREIPLGLKWKFEIRHSRFSKCMRDQITQLIKYSHIYDNADRATVAQFIFATIKETYWDFWGLWWEVSSSDCTLYIQDHGGNTYAIFVEGPGPNDITCPISFTLTEYEHNT